MRTHPKAAASTAGAGALPIAPSIIFSHLGSNRLSRRAAPRSSGRFSVNSGRESDVRPPAGGPLSGLTANRHRFRIDTSSFKERTTLDARATLAASISSRSAMTVLKSNDDARSDATTDAAVSSAFVVAVPCPVPLSKNASAKASSNGGKVVTRSGTSFCFSRQRLQEVDPHAVVVVPRHARDDGLHQGGGRVPLPVQQLPREPAPGLLRVLVAQKERDVQALAGVHGGHEVAAVEDLVRRPPLPPRARVVEAVALLRQPQRAL